MGVEGAIAEGRDDRRQGRGALRPLDFLQRMRERHGDMFTVRLPGEQPLLVVGDPQLVEQVFQAPADVLHAGEGNSRGLGWVHGKHSLALLDGQRHMSHRRLLLPAFHNRRLERHAARMRALAEAQLDAWPSGEEVAALPRMRAIALEAVVDAVFGEGEPERLDPLRSAVPELQAAGVGNGDSPAAHRLVERVAALVGEEVAARRTGARLSEREDMLSLLLEARYEDGAPLADVEVRDEAMMLLIAGYETTATSLAWALERLARNPAALAAAEEDAADGGGDYIDAAIYETLRSRPAVTMSARLVKQPFRLGDREIAPGTLIALSALLVHHRPDIYPEPMSFLPERFLDQQPGTYTWIPFGGGVRRCIGVGFALMEMRIVLSALLSRMALRPAGPEPEGMQTVGSRLVPVRGARVVLERRNSAAGSPAPPSERWSDAGSWVGDGLRREVFFFRSGGADLYGSLYAAAQLSRPYGVVACQSWGVEAERTEPLARSVALEMAKLGGAGFVFHYPGYGDSFGDLADLDLTDLVTAAGDAVAEASRRRPGLDWILAGFMLGASVACLAQRRADAKLLLVQPELRPGSYFRRLAKASEPLAPGSSPRQMMEPGVAPGMSYGYPIPHRIAAPGSDADEAVASALAGFEGDGAVIRHLKPEEETHPVPERLERIGVGGAYRFGSQNHLALARASAEWLERSTSP